MSSRHYPDNYKLYQRNKDGKYIRIGGRGAANKVTPVCINGTNYDSMEAAAQHYGVAVPTLYGWVAKGKVERTLAE